MHREWTGRKQLLVHLGLQRRSLQQGRVRRGQGVGSSAAAYALALGALLITREPVISSARAKSELVIMVFV